MAAKKKTRQIISWFFHRSLIRLKTKSATWCHLVYFLSYLFDDIIIVRYAFLFSHYNNVQRCCLKKLISDKKLFVSWVNMIFIFCHQQLMKKRRKSKDVYSFHSNTFAGSLFFSFCRCRSITWFDYINSFFAFF